MISYLKVKFLNKKFFRLAIFKLYKKILEIFVRFNIIKSRKYLRTFFLKKYFNIILIAKLINITIFI